MASAPRFAGEQHKEDHFQDRNPAVTLPVQTGIQAQEIHTGEVPMEAAEAREEADSRAEEALIKTAEGAPEENCRGI